MRSEFILLLKLFEYVLSLKLYKSQLTLEVDEGISGLQYLEKNQENFAPTNSLTTCIRFMFRRLSESDKWSCLNVKNRKIIF